MHVRTMTAEDLDAVVHVEYSATNFPWPKEMFQQSLDAGHYCRVIETDYGLAGFAIFSQVLDEATLLNIAVCPSFQRQGLARRLLQGGVKELQRQAVKVCFLEVRRSNQAAINLYQRYDFVEVGMRKNYYPADQGREDAIVMKRCLNQQQETS